MATNRKRKMRGLKPELSTVFEKYFETGEEPSKDHPDALELCLLKGTVKEKQVWRELRDKILPAWIAEYPGTRCFGWWAFDAPRDNELMAGTRWEGTLPIQRRRLAGIGTARYEVLNIVPDFFLGVPTSFVSEFEQQYYNGVARDVHGQLIENGYTPGHFKGITIDDEDPPVYESQAAYLRRHGLLEPAEEKRLSDEDFEPQTIYEIWGEEE